MPKTVAFGALLEDEVGKMCTRLQREFFNVYSFIHFISFHVVSFHFIHCFVSQQLQLTTISIVYHLPKLVHFFSWHLHIYLPAYRAIYLPIQMDEVRRCFLQSWHIDKTLQIGHLFLAQWFPINIYVTSLNPRGPCPQTWPAASEFHRPHNSHMARPRQPRQARPHMPRART